jgi:XTP/dITP diphosphohydrolase
MGKRINYLTTNELKFSIARRYFDSIDGYELVQHSFDVPEIQAESCEEIAVAAAIFAAKAIGEPCIKLDVGFYIPSLGGFPGPFVKYINEWLSESDVLAMVSQHKDRSAYFLDVTAIGFPDGTSKTFALKRLGKIAHADGYAASDWPTNSLFIPDGNTIPLGSMSVSEQEEFWGAGAWPMVAEYIASL